MYRPFVFYALLILKNIITLRLSLRLLHNVFLMTFNSHVHERMCMFLYFFLCTKPNITALCIFLLLFYCYECVGARVCAQNLRMHLTCIKTKEKKRTLARIHTFNIQRENIVNKN